MNEQDVIDQLRAYDVPRDDTQALASLERATSTVRQQRMRRFVSGGAGGVAALAVIGLAVGTTQWLPGRGPGNVPATGGGSPSAVSDTSVATSPGTAADTFEPSEDCPPFRVGLPDVPPVGDGTEISDMPVIATVPAGTPVVVHAVELVGFGVAQAAKVVVVTPGTDGTIRNGKMRTDKPIEAAQILATSTVLNVPVAHKQALPVTFSTDQPGTYPVFAMTQSPHGFTSPNCNDVAPVPAGTVDNVWNQEPLGVIVVK